MWLCRSLVLILFLILIFLSPSCVRKGASIALEVGEFQFSQKDLELREKVIHYYFPNESKPNPKRDLITAYQLVQAMLNNGLEEFRERVIEEDRRISNSTLDPIGLAKIRRYFDGDEEAYRRLFIVPILAPRLFEDFGQRNLAVQSQSRQKVSHFLDAATKQPKRFKTLAKAQKLSCRTLRVSEENGVRFGDRSLDGNSGASLSGISPDVDPVLTQQWMKQTSEAAKTDGQRWVREFAVSLKPGDVSPRIVDSGGVWLAVQLVGLDRKNNELVFESVEFPKDPINQWRTTELAKIKVTER